MNRLAFIWDLDGTILDSYDVIVGSLFDVCKEHGLDIDRKDILNKCINESVSSFIHSLEEKYHIEYDEFRKRYSLISGERKLDIRLMKNAKEILEYLQSKDIDNYVFTHRGKTTEIVLKHLGIYSYFKDIVTSLNGFKSKPNPEGVNYLVNKYELDKENTFYVGDRSLDIECANNASIKSIMFIPKESVATPNGKETYVINDLLEIKELIS